MPIKMGHFEFADGGGLICGFTLEPTGPAQPLQWDRLRESSAENSIWPFDKPVWLHFNLADTRATQWIATCVAIPQDARDLLLDIDAHIRSEIFDDGFALVIADLHHDFNDDPEGLGVLRVYVNHHCVITGRRHPLKAVDQLRRSMMAGLEVPTTIELLGHLIQDLGEIIHSVIKNISDTVDDAEDEILAGRVQERGAELGRLRRLLARLRRHMNAGRAALAHCVASLRRHVEREDMTRLHQSVERLDGVAQDLELAQERARLLQEEIAAQLGEATNRNLYILSLMTTALLPINLITGVFGMNTGGLPWATEPSGFSRAVICMLIGVAVSLGILHWRKIL